MPENPASDIYDLYSEATEIANPVQREAFIQSRCGDDGKLAERLRAMLAVREDADAMFENAAEFHAAHRDDGALDAGELGRVGRFRLERLVGRGGMGNVFLGYDEQLERPVALKFPRLDTMGNPELLDRFLREARLAAQLSHPNLVEIYEVGVWGQACFIASKWCEGGDLAAWLDERPGPQDPAWSARLVRYVARAVAYCHQQGVVHLDIKPANIMLEPDVERDGDPLAVNPILTDFGVARVIEEGLPNSHTSLLLGTPLYMAPEQAECDRDRIGPTCDVFALGVILHELLYGRRPFEGETAMQVLDQLRAADTLVPPADRSVPRDLRTICERCLQRDPASRYPSADALAEDLDRHLRGEPVHARPVSLAERLGRWMQRPERVRDAGIALIMMNVALPATMFVSTLTPIFDPNSPMAAMPVARLFRSNAPSAIASFGIVWCGMRVLKGAHWALALATLAVAAQWIYCSAILFFGAPALAEYEGNPLAKLLVHLLLWFLFTFELAVCIAALCGQRQQKRRIGIRSDVARIAP